MPSVRDTADFRRVRALPRRALSESDAAAWAAVLTDEYRKPGGTQTLRPWQAYCLAECAEVGGLLGGLPVGIGKTLITWLLPSACRSERPILVVPASLKAKTYADFGAFLPHWRAPRTPIRIVTLQELAPERGANLLTSIDPDLVMVDECDELANAESSAARRLARFLGPRECTLAALSGTLSRRSILGYAHLLWWALGEGAPVPLTISELRDWAGALDESPQGAREGVAGRVGCGVLGRDRTAARAWYRQRLAETPGVVLVDGDSCDAPLTIRVRLAREDAALDSAFRDFATTLETPEGMPVSDPLSRWRMDAQLGCGLYLRWNPQPPEAWREARRAVARFVRERIAASTRSAKPLDTEAQVLRRFEDHPIVRAWLEVRGTFTPQTEAVWLSTSTIESARDWLGESSTPGIIWTGCVEFGEACARALRLPYYGRGGKDANGRGLHEADARRSFVCSWGANKRGFNLQAWRRQLLIMPPQSAKYLEQMYGRSHRSGQTEPVTVDVLATSGGTLDAFDTAIAEAEFARETVGMTQKALRATITHAAPRVTAANRYRWARKEGGAKPEAEPTRSIASRLKKSSSGLATRDRI